MKWDPKNERGRRGRGRKHSFFFLPHPLPALLLAPFFARSLTLVPLSLLLNRTERLATVLMLLSGEPQVPGGEVLPIMESFFSNDGQIMHMNIISLILVWHCCWASNTRWLEKILKKKDWEPYSATNIRSFTTLNLPTMKTNKQQQQNNKIYVSWCIKWKADFVRNWFAISTQLSNHLLITCNGQSLFYLASLR